jgi:hypothetical protein
VNGKGAKRMSVKVVGRGSDEGGTGTYNKGRRRQGRAKLWNAFLFRKLDKKVVVRS